MKTNEKVLLGLAVAVVIGIYFYGKKEKKSNATGSSKPDSQGDCKCKDGRTFARECCGNAMSLSQTATNQKFTKK